ncbi:hypothetical protein SprV_0401651600 [Sparganum proliferum]
MKLFIGLCLLLVTAYAIPTADTRGSPHNETVTNSTKDETVTNSTKDERSNKEKFADLLKDVGYFFLQHFKGVFKEKSKQLVSALIDISSDEVLPSLFEGNASRIMKEFLLVFQQKHENYSSWAEFFKDQIDDIFAEVLVFFGAKGGDLLTVSTNLVNGTTHKLLTAYATNLTNPEIEAISAAVSGIGKTIAKIIIKTEDWLKNLLNFLRKEVAQLVKVTLQRWLDHQGIIYNIIEKILSSRLLNT